EQGVKDEGRAGRGGEEEPRQRSQSGAGARGGAVGAPRRPAVAGGAAGAGRRGGVPLLGRPRVLGGGDRAEEQRGGAAAQHEREGAVGGENLGRLRRGQRHGAHDHGGGRRPLGAALVDPEQRLVDHFVDEQAAVGDPAQVGVGGEDRAHPGGGERTGEQRPGG